VPQDATAAAAALLCHRQSGSTGRRLSPRPRTLTFNQIAIHSPGLPFNGLHLRNSCNYIEITWITTHSPTPAGWKAEWARLADP